MKLLHIITSLQTGGAEKLLLESIPSYVERGLEVDLLLLNGTESIFLKELKGKNICNIYSLSKKSVYNPFYIFKIIPFLKNYDIIHVHLFPTLYWVALASLFSNTKNKLVYTEHSTHNKRREKKWLKPIERFIYSRYAEIICISNKTRENLNSWINIPRNIKTIITINNGINLSTFDKAPPLDRKELGIPHEAKIILMTARFNIQKDPNTLIRAFSLLNNSDLYLIFVGDGKLITESKSLAKKLNLEHKILFLGIRQDVPSLIKMSDICVLSSNWEGFGLVAAEYMAGGKPCIVSDIEGLGDVVRGAGLLFEKGNPEDLKLKLNELISDKNKYNNISNLCMERAKDFDISKMVSLNVDIYKKVYKNTVIISR